MIYYKVGDVVAAKKFGPLEHDFSGEVEKVYDNSIMVAIKDFDPADQSGVNELNGRAIVRKDAAKMLKKVPRTAEDRAAAEQEAQAAAEKAAKSSKSSRRRRQKRQPPRQRQKNQRNLKKVVTNS